MFCSFYARKRMTEAPDQYDFIVVGSGIGGLVSAVLLGMEGHRVLVLEKNHQIGGSLQVFSRDKRIFDDPTGQRSAKNANPFLLQTYARDTGEVMSDLSLSIYIEDQQWAAVRLGFNPVVLLQES